MPSGGLGSFAVLIGRPVENGAAFDRSPRFLWLSLSLFIDFSRAARRGSRPTVSYHHGDERCNKHLSVSLVSGGAGGGPRFAGSCSTSLQVFQCERRQARVTFDIWRRFRFASLEPSPLDGDFKFFKTNETVVPKLHSR